MFVATCENLNETSNLGLKQKTATKLYHQPNPGVSTPVYCATVAVFFRWTVRTSCKICFTPTSKIYQPGDSSPTRWFSRRGGLPLSPQTLEVTNNILWKGHLSRKSLPKKTWKFRVNGIPLFLGKKLILPFCSNQKDRWVPPNCRCGVRCGPTSRALNGLAPGTQEAPGKKKSRLPFYWNPGTDIYIYIYVCIHIP